MQVVCGISSFMMQVHEVRDIHKSCEELNKMLACVLRHCKNNTENCGKTKGICFHRFPLQSHPNRKEWIQFVRHDRQEELWLPTCSTRICSLHFQEQDQLTTKSGKLFLKKTAVPCLMFNNSSQRSATPDEPVPPSSEGLASSSDGTLSKIVLKSQLPKSIRFRVKQTKHNISLQRKCRRLKKRTPPLAEVIRILNAKKLLDDELNWKLEYCEDLTDFSLMLNYYSSTAYRFVRQTFKNVFPHPRTLIKQYGSTNAKPGFTVEAFVALKKKCDATEKRVICSLVFDQMEIRSQEIFMGKITGLVDVGLGSEDIDKVANRVLVFMVVSLTENWKIPVGYFLMNNVEPELKASLMKTCLRKCHEVGVEIASITFEACYEHNNAAHILGCRFRDPKQMKTHFPHPSTGAKVFVFLDPCSVMKMVKHTFERKILLFDKDNNKINWQLLQNLNNLQHNDCIKFNNKITPSRIYFRNQIMKVKLATQLLSGNVAKTLILCDEELKSSSFKNSHEIVHFVTMMNTFFDIMYVEKFNCSGSKHPLDAKNQKEIFTFLETLKDYILSLTYLTKKERVIFRRNRSPQIINYASKNILVESDKIGFLGIIICIESLKGLYCDLIDDRKMLSHISTYRISQDHIQLFLGCTRKHEGPDNDPKLLHFLAAYKKILNYLELRDSLRINCNPLDNFTSLNSSSIDIINSTSMMCRLYCERYQEYIRHSGLHSDLEVANNCQIFAKLLNENRPHLTGATNQMVGYISGFVSRILIRQIKCEQCAESLLANNKLWFHKLITLKDMGGLCYSSQDVFKVCLTTESLIGRLVADGMDRTYLNRYYLKYITANTLKRFVNSDVFDSLVQHSLQQPATFNHRLHLIRATIQIYANLKFYHAAKIDQSLKYPTNRQKMTKLILFQGNKLSDS